LSALGKTEEGEEEGEEEGMFLHVVFFKFKPEVPEEEMAGIMKEVADLKGKIPVLKEFLVGKNVSKAGQGYHYAQVSVLKRKEDLPIYEQHPEHQKVVQRILPALESIIAMDFEPL
jgi:hypothetical protein